MELAQLGWNAWKEIINFSTPLAILIGIGIGLYKFGMWICKEFIEPVFGSDGALPKYLASQHEAMEKQAQEMRLLAEAIRLVGTSSTAKMDELLTFAEDSARSNDSVVNEVTDLLLIHRHWAEAAKMLAANDTVIHEHLAAIRRIVDKYCE